MCLCAAKSGARGFQDGNGLCTVDSAVPRVHVEAVDLRVVFHIRWSVYLYTLVAVAFVGVNGCPSRSMSVGRSVVICTRVRVGFFRKKNKKQSSIRTWPVSGLLSRLLAVFRPQPCYIVARPRGAPTSQPATLGCIKTHLPKPCFRGWAIWLHCCVSHRKGTLPERWLPFAVHGWLRGANVTLSVPRLATGMHARR